MELKLATPEQVREIYERDLKVSFPPAELKPVKNILEMMEAGCYRPWCLFDGDEIVGECFLWLGRPGWALLDYLCVSPGRRNGGTGAVLLEKMRRAEPETVILGESGLLRPQRRPHRQIRHGDVRRALQDALLGSGAHPGRDADRGPSVHLSKPVFAGEI